MDQNNRPSSMGTRRLSSLTSAAGSSRRVSLKRSRNSTDFRDQYEQERDTIIKSIIDDIFMDVTEIGWQRYLHKEVVKFVSKCAANALADIIDLCFLQIDQGDDPNKKIIQDLKIREATKDCLQAPCLERVHECVDASQVSPAERSIPEHPDGESILTTPQPIDPEELRLMWEKFRHEIINDRPSSIY